MNPGASEFFPGRSSKPAKAPPGSQPLKGPPGSTPAESSLRASARVFVPKTTKAPMAKSSTPLPSYAASVAVNTPPLPGPAHTDPAAGVQVTEQSSSLSPDAHPYTPTKGEGGGEKKGTTPPFPSSPSKAGSMSEPEPTTPAAAAAAVATDAETTPIKPKSEVFKDSKLPVPDAAREPPAAPIALNAAWTLHADDHAIMIGMDQKASFHDPVVIHTVKDLEQFWRLWRHVPNPMSRTPNFTYYWFRKDVKPNWEDSRNKNGGTLNAILFDRDRIGLQDRGVVDDAFMVAVLACTGESIAESTIVNGVVLKLRQKSVMLQLWTTVTAKAQLQALADSLRTHLKDIASPLTLEKGKIDFFTHQQVISSVAAKTQSGKKKPASRAPTREADYQL